MEPSPEVATPAQVRQLQEVRPVWELQGHEVCGDVHIALSVAEAVLTSQRNRIADLPDDSFGDALLRELQALGVKEASPQTIAMVALVDTAVHRLADLGAMSEQDAWRQLRDEVLGKHCKSPTTDVIG
jgi:hypothetical protein